MYLFSIAALINHCKLSRLKESLPSPSRLIISQSCRSEVRMAQWASLLRLPQGWNQDAFSSGARFSSKVILITGRILVFVTMDVRSPFSYWLSARGHLQLLQTVHTPEHMVPIHLKAAMIYWVFYMISTTLTSSSASGLRKLFAFQGSCDQMRPILILRSPVPYNITWYDSLITLTGTSGHRVIPSRLFLEFHLPQHRSTRVP